VTAPGSAVMSTGTVYLLHFDQPYAHARHYLGWTRGPLARRLRQHGKSHGARLTQVVAAAGITWQLARTWEGDHDREAQLKRQGGRSRMCPLCGVHPRQATLPRNADGSISRSRTPDWLKAEAGIMTAAQQAEHSALRHGAVSGRVAGVEHLAATPAQDPWYFGGVA